MISLICGIKKNPIKLKNTRPQLIDTENRLVITRKKGRELNKMDEVNRRS